MVFTEVVRILCGLMAIVNMAMMFKSRKDKKELDLLCNGFFGIVMVLLWKL